MTAPSPFRATQGRELFGLELHPDSKPTQCHEAILSIIFKAPPANKEAAIP